MLRVPAAVGRDLSDGAGAVDATDGDSMKRKSRELWIARLGEVVFVWNHRPTMPWMFLSEPYDSINVSQCKQMFGAVPRRRPLRFLLRRA